LLSIDESSHPLVHGTNCPVHCYADQYDAHHFQRRMKIHVPKLCKVRNFSSSRKSLLFTDDLLQKYIKQVVAEWSQIQKQLTDDEFGSGQAAAKHISKRRSFLEPVVSKVMQHQQCSANIAELEDIISGVCLCVCTFTFRLIVSDFFCICCIQNVMCLSRCYSLALFSLYSVTVSYIIPYY